MSPKMANLIDFKSTIGPKSRFSCLRTSQYTFWKVYFFNFRHKIRDYLVLQLKETASLGTKYTLMRNSAVCWFYN
uniref:Uncharacterized protein n=1 Tax=uncultured marine crenarchaeote HF4000_APKG8I13 TaxID=455606 RepID=B3TB05_9ARCH|nr:hypothetical protein ALOHA_HF4000APKG8I13ctg1g34 [uncultured marine crenarchaeote HF4000_APKG8I13]